MELNRYDREKSRKENNVIENDWENLREMLVSKFKDRCKYRN
jgi:hypothetical protein